MLCMPIGYPVEDAPVNCFPRTRLPIGEVLTWLGITP